MLAGIQQANTHALQEMLETTFKLLALCEGTSMSDWHVNDYIMPFLIETLDSLAVLIKLRRPKVVFFCQWITPLVPHFVQSRSSTPSREARKKEKLNKWSVKSDFIFKRMISSTYSSHCTCIQHFSADNKSTPTGPGFQNKYQRLVKWERFIGYLAGSGGTKKASPGETY